MRAALMMALPRHASFPGRDPSRLTLDDELRLTREIEQAEASMARALVLSPAALSTLARVGDCVQGENFPIREVVRLPGAPGMDGASASRVAHVLARAGALADGGTEADRARLGDDLVSLRLRPGLLRRAAAAMDGNDERARRAFARAWRASRVAKEEWTTASAYLVFAIARRYRRPGVETVDLVQDGNIGLIRAVEKFDSTMGHRFHVYAAWWIRQQIFRALADYGRTIRVPLPMVEAGHRIARARRVFEGIHGREPEDGELAAASGLDLATVAAVRAIAEEPISFHSGSAAFGESDLLDRIADGSTAPPDEQVAASRLKGRLHALFESLAVREREVVRLRFGLDGGREHTLTEIATSLGLSRERVRKTEERALAKLRALLLREGLRAHLAA